MSNLSTDSLPTLSPDRRITLLDRAWNLFHLYDYHANRAQARFLWLRKSILTCGVIAVFLAIVESLSESWIPASLPPETRDILSKILRAFVIVMPIAITVLLAGSVKFDRGTSWVILRAAAESIKGEIYRYRCRVDRYKNPTTRDINLADSLQQINERLMKTQVNQIGIDPAEEKQNYRDSISLDDTDRESSLSAEEYIKVRVVDQYEFYRKKIRKIYRETQWLYWSVYSLGGISAFLAAFGWGIWVAVTTAISTAIVTYIAIRQLDNTLINYNQAATNLDNLLLWWDSLSFEAKEKLFNFEKLVNNTENILGTEVSGWVQEMQDALADLYKEDREKIEKQSSEEYREIIRKTFDIKYGVDSEAVVSTVSDRATSDENPEGTGEETGASGGGSDRSPNNENSTDTEQESS